MAENSINQLYLLLSRAVSFPARSLSLSLSLGLVWWRREQRKGEREACVGGGKKVMCVVEKGKDKIR
jgi:hypothetical protein